MLNAGSLTVNRKNVDQVRGKPRPSADIKIAVTFGGRQYSISALLRYGVCRAKAEDSSGQVEHKLDYCNVLCKFW